MASLFTPRGATLVRRSIVGAHHQMRAVSKCEAQFAGLNASTTLPGIWPNMPYPEFTISKPLAA